MPDSPYLAQLRKQLNDQNAQPRAKPAPAGAPPPEPKNTHDWALDEDGMPQRVLRKYPDETIERPEAMTRQGNEDARKWVRHEDIAHTPMDADVSDTAQQYSPAATYHDFNDREHLKWGRAEPVWPEEPNPWAKSGLPAMPTITTDPETGQPIQQFSQDVVPPMPSRHPAAPVPQRDTYVDEGIPTHARNDAARADTQSLGLPAPPPTGYDEATQRLLDEQRRKRAMAPPADWLRFGEEKP